MAASSFLSLQWTSKSFRVRVLITTHSPVANRLTLTSLPRLGPVANGGFIFKQRDATGGRSRYLRAVGLEKIRPPVTKPFLNPRALA